MQSTKGLKTVEDKKYDQGQKVRMQLDQIVNTLNGMDVGMALVWLWVWDVISDKYKNYSSDDFSNDYVITEGTTLDVIWNKLWDSPPNDFTLEYGAEQLDEAIFDWMIDQDFIAALEDDEWLDEVAELEEANI